MNKETKIASKLKDLSLDKYCQVHGYSLREGGKVSAYGLIEGFFHWFNQGQNSLSQWASQIGLILGITLSKQGLVQRLNTRTVNLCRALLEKALEQQAFKGLPSGLFEGFSAVYLEDSTCQSLPAKLSAAFRGAYSKKLKQLVATLRIQLCLELLSHRYRKIEIGSFSQNDQSYAPEILQILKPGNLVMRDLGYWGIRVFDQIGRLEAFFLSRYQPGVNLYNALTNEPIDLPTLLRKAKAARQTQLDLRVLIGSEHRLEVRLIALLVPDRISNQRRRKAKQAAKTDARIKYSQDYFSLLDWNLLVTNVPDQTWTPYQAYLAYQFRWRIEICFKSWKSALNFKPLFQNKQSLTPEQVYIMLYLTLLWLVLFLTPWFSFFLHAIEQKYKRYLSLILFTRFARDHFSRLINANDLSELIPNVAAHAVHERRKRISQVEWLFILQNLALD